MTFPIDYLALTLQKMRATVRGCGLRHMNSSYSSTQPCSLTPDFLGAEQQIYVPNDKLNRTNKETSNKTITTIAVQK
jgi:hypothetical protein